MNTFGPLLGTFVFFGVLFLVGRVLQGKEKRKREQEKLRAKDQDLRARLNDTSQLFRRYGQSQTEGLGETFGGSGSGQSAGTYGASQGGHA